MLSQINFMLSRTDKLKLLLSQILWQLFNFEKGQNIATYIDNQAAMHVLKSNIRIHFQNGLRMPKQAEITLT